VAPVASGAEREIHELGGQLRAAANAWAAGDGAFDEAAATRLRRQAIARCHAHYRARVPAYRRLCAEAGVGEDAPLEVLAERCTVTDDLFKSYDAAWVGGRDFAALSDWLGDVSAEPVPAAAAAAQDVDDWLDRLDGGGLHVLYSSGTSGKLSFVPRGEASWDAYRANGPSYLMHQVQRLGLDLAAMDGAVLGFRGGRMGIQRAGVELARYIADVTYLYDHELRAETLRTLLATRSPGADVRPGAAAPEPDDAYRRLLGALRRATERGRALWLFGAPYQVRRLCGLVQAAGLPPLTAGSVVTLGGGWKSFEGERIDHRALGALIEATLGVPPARVLEAYAMVELNTPLMRCRDGRYHVPPILEPWLFDEALVPLPPGDDVTGTFGFMDPTATSYPAFLVTGDEVRLVRAPCPCGLVGPAIVGEVRRAAGREVRGCGGILATVRA
jgi:Acyl-protein synthetase, LuxE